MNSPIQTDTFTSDGNARLITLRQDLDWIYVLNETNAGASGDDSVWFYFQRGMSAGTGVRWYKSGGGDNLNITTLSSPNGFTLIDQGTVTNTTSANQLTNISAGDPPRVTSTAHGLVTGDIVRLTNATGAAQLGGINFRVTRIDANNFDLSYMEPIVVAGSPGSDSRVVKISHESIFVPDQRVITNVTQASSAVVTFAAPHNFNVGQIVRFSVPGVTTAAYGMTELDGLSGSVTAVSTANNTITVDIDTSGFTAFSFPLTADSPFTPAQASPVGADLAVARNNSVDELLAATRNEGVIGVNLAGGSDSPGGANNDVMYWQAGRSFINNNNQ